MAEDGQRQDPSGLADQVWDEPTSQLEVLRSQLEAAVAEELAKVRSETMAATEARLAAVEAALRERLDSLARRSSESADKANAVMSAVHADSARLAALAEHVDNEMPRLVEAVETMRKETPRRTDLDALRAELEAALARTSSDDPPGPPSVGGALEAASGGPLRSELEALSALLERARSEIEITVATTESVALAAEARLTQRLDLIAERASAEAVATAPGTVRGPSATEHRRLREKVSALERAVAELHEAGKPAPQRPRKARNLAARAPTESATNRAPREQD